MRGSASIHMYCSPQNTKGVLDSWTPALSSTITRHSAIDAKANNCHGVGNYKYESDFHDRGVGINME